MTTPTPEAIEAAARALLFRETMSEGGLSLDQMADIALTAAAPFIAAQAKAEALREAAEYIDAGDYADMNPDGTMRPRLTQVQISQRNRTVTANWLRARAATIEGKSE